MNDSRNFTNHFLKDSLHGEQQGLGLLDSGRTAGKNRYRAGLGVSGALLLACQYGLAHQEEELPGSVEQALDCLAGRFTQSNPGKPGLFEGVAGILFGLSHVYGHFPGKKIEQLLDQGLHALLASVRKTYLPLPPDLADGYAGILLGAAYCYHQTQHSLCPEIMNNASERLLAGARLWENAVVWDYHIHHNHFIAPPVDWSAGTAGIAWALFFSGTLLQNDCWTGAAKLILRGIGAAIPGDSIYTTDYNSRLDLKQLVTLSRRARQEKELGTPQPSQETSLRSGSTGIVLTYCFCKRHAPDFRVPALEKLLGRFSADGSALPAALGPLESNLLGTCVDGKLRGVPPDRANKRVPVADHHPGERRDAAQPAVPGYSLADRCLENVIHICFATAAAIAAPGRNRLAAPAGPLHTVGPVAFVEGIVKKDFPVTAYLLAGRHKNDMQAFASALLEKGVTLRAFGELLSTVADPLIQDGYQYELFKKRRETGISDYLTGFFREAGRYHRIRSLLTQPRRIFNQVPLVIGQDVTLLAAACNWVALETALKKGRLSEADQLLGQAAPVTLAMRYSHEYQRVIAFSLDGWDFIINGYQEGATLQDLIDELAGRAEVRENYSRSQLTAIAENVTKAYVYHGMIEPAGASVTRHPALNHH